MEIRRASDQSLLVSFASEISLDAHRQVLRLMRGLAGRWGVRNLHPAYASLLVTYDPRIQTAEAMRRHVEQAAAAPLDLPEPRTVEIPVHYDGQDLENVARLHQLTPEQVIAIHSGAEYLVYFLGFSPGFPYMGGLPEAIATPRLPAPRRMVPAGSVGIAGGQTGIYPVASPGGWRLIGRTDLVLFDPQRNPPTLLEAGDRVRFLPLP